MTGNRSLDEFLEGSEPAESSDEAAAEAAPTAPGDADDGPPEPTRPSGGPAADAAEEEEEEEETDPAGGSDAAEEETDPEWGSGDGPTANGLAADEDRDDDPSVPEPMAETFAWSAAGGPCAGCGEAADVRWRDGDAMVCADCKAW